MPLRLPRVPSAFTRNLGTANREMPLEPSGASGRRANTSGRCCRPCRVASRDEDLGAGDLVGAVSVARPCAAGPGRYRSVARSGTWCQVHLPLVSLGRYMAFARGAVHFQASVSAVAQAGAWSRLGWPSSSFHRWPGSPVGACPGHRTRVSRQGRTNRFRCTACRLPLKPSGS